MEKSKVMLRFRNITHLLNLIYIIRLSFMQNLVSHNAMGISSHYSIVANMCSYKDISANARAAFKWPIVFLPI